MFNKEDKIFLIETEEIFKTEKGKRVLDYLRKVLHVEETLEPEEKMNKDLEAAGRIERIPIDPIAFAKRQGSRSAYYKIIALIRQGKRMREEDSK